MRLALELATLPKEADPHHEVEVPTRASVVNDVGADVLSLPASPEDR